MPLLPGAQLNQRYRIVSLLGQGPYGAVYRAWDLVDERDCAIKEYLGDDPELRRRFRAEARRLSRLKHPQLPAVWDHFSLDGEGQYLVNAYVDGVDLRELVGQYGPLPEEQIIHWLQAVAEPLGYLHQQGQLHLNVKPANVRITAAGAVFLVDTGLPGLGTAPGTDGYAAPEQQKQAEVDHLADIYGLGATLYTALTGQAPVKALSRETGLTEQRSAREVNPDVAPYLSIVAGRALDLRPDVRFESAAAFAQALERPVGRANYEPAGPRRTADTYLGTAPPPKVPPTRRRTIEQRTLMGLVGVLLALTGLVGGYLIANRPATLPGGSQAAATATFQSQVVAAITAISTPPSPTPTETPHPTATPGPIVSETGVRMLFVGGGVFRMGNDDAEADERPSHLLRLDAFYIDEMEVTNAEYARCVADGVCAAPARASASYHPAYYGNPAYDNFPVIFVDWPSADAFCTWRGARLPTEAEWEKAAGFDPVQFQRRLFPWGDLFDGTLLNYCDASCAQEWRDTSFNDEHQDTSPVGSFPAGRSPTGALDMLGNVKEWVADWYDPRYFETTVDINPRGPLEGTARSVRGGSWFSRPEDVRVTDRDSFVPSVSRANLGFRCALTPP